MAEPARRTTNYEDLVKLPGNLVGEIVDGDLYACPRPGPRHATAASAAMGDLNSAYSRRSPGGGGPGGWWILDEPELHLGADVVVPDLAGWRRTRMPRLPEEPYFALAPDWICEVLSPSTERLDRAAKKRVYGREGVRHMWLVNPLAQTLEILRRSGEFWQEVETLAGSAVVRAEPFLEIEIDLSRWWETE